MHRRRYAKIVATLGPASSSSEMIRALFEAAADVFRFNFSHGTHDEHQARYDIVRAIEAETGRPIAVLADLQGPAPKDSENDGGAHKKKGRLRCHKRPKSREETPKEGSDSGVGGRYRIPLAKTIAISGSIERKGSRTDTKVYGA